MNAEKTIVATGYTVIPAENGGFIVEGKGVNTGVRHAFSNVREYLEFVCSQHTGDNPMHYFNENWRQDFIKRSAELSRKAGQSIGGSIDYSLYPKALCDKLADDEKAETPKFKLRVGGVYEDGVGDHYTIIYATGHNGVRIYYATCGERYRYGYLEDGRSVEDIDDPASLMHFVSEVLA